MVTTFLVALDMTAVNVGLLAIARSLHSDVAGSSAVSIAYLTGAAACMPLAGALTQRWGPRRLYLIALALFLLASAACAASATLPELVVGRAVQGAASGMLAPLVAGMLFRAFDAQERVGIARLLMIGWVSAPALGPLFGGWCVTVLSWRWIFLVTVLLGTVLFGFCARALPKERVAGARTADRLGWWLSPVGLSLVFFALARSAGSGWSDGWVLGSAACGALLVTVFVLAEIRSAAPLLRLRLLADVAFWTPNLVSLLGVTAFSGLIFLVPLLVQAGHGGSPLAAGESIFWEAIGVQLASQVAGRSYRRIGPYRLMALGLLGTSAVVLLLLDFGPHTSLWWLRLAVFTIGLCMGGFFMPVQVIGYERVSHADLGHATAVVNIQRQLASALGVAVLGTVLTHDAHGTTIPFGAFHVGVVVIATLSALAGGVSWWASIRTGRTEAATQTATGPEISPSSPATSPPNSSPQT
ncbi:MAG TPA: MFS transporter [Pseudonocardiaceae bacterium]|nr:MFS transporter [Pseudonocardiaceae bacterium]